MTFRRSLNQQWSKSILAHRLALSLQDSDKLQQFFGGATSLSTVMNTISALVFAEGEPTWLPPMQSCEQAPLEHSIVLYCLFTASRLLFIKEIEQGKLNQSEHLVLTIAYQWSQSITVTDSTGDTLCDNANQLCQLLQTINNQLEIIRTEKRKSSRNMGD